MVLTTSSEDEAPPKQKPIAKPKPKQSFGAALTKGSTIVTAESLLADVEIAIALDEALAAAACDGGLLPHYFCLNEIRREAPRGVCTTATCAPV